MSAGKARTDDMEIISTSNPSFAKPPVSFAIQSDAMVPEVNKYAIRNGRVAAACVSFATAANASNQDEKRRSDASQEHSIGAAAKRHRESILLFIAKTSWIRERNVGA